MKKTVSLFLALVLVLAMTLAAAAEGADAVKGIFETLIGEGSDYSAAKAMYEEYFPETVMEESLDGDSFTLTVSGNEYMNGSWTFTKDGDYLTATVGSDDFSGNLMGNYVLFAAGKYFGMNTSLMTGYIAGLDVLGLENPYYRVETDDAAGTSKISIYIGGPYEMKELDQMVLTESVMGEYGFTPLDQDDMSRAFNFGKISMIMDGTVGSSTFLLFEYGDLDDVALQALITVASVLKPAGWEDFTANYTALETVATPDYSVVVNPDKEAVLAIVDEMLDGYSCVLAQFGSEDSEDAYDASQYEIDESFNGTEWKSGDMTLESVWQDGLYKIVISTEDTELVYLCYQDDENGTLYGMGTGDPDLDETQPDHGAAQFYFNDEGNLVWQNMDGEETAFTLVEE